MKKVYVLTVIFIFASSLIVAGCGKTDNSNPNKPNVNQTQDMNNSNSSSNNMGNMDHSKM